MQVDINAASVSLCHVVISYQAYRKVFVIESFEKQLGFLNEIEK